MNHNLYRAPSRFRIRGLPDGRE